MALVERDLLGETRLTVGGWIVAVLIGIIIVAAVSAATAAIFMLLWNWIVASWLGGPSITFWLAWGILFLLGMIGRRFVRKG